MVADLFQVLQTPPENVDCANVLGGLDAEVHRALGGMWHGVPAEGDIGTGREGGGGLIIGVILQFIPHSLSRDDRL